MSWVDKISTGVKFIDRFGNYKLAAVYVYETYKGYKELDKQYPGLWNHRGNPNRIWSFKNGVPTYHEKKTLPKKKNYGRRSPTKKYQRAVPKRQTIHVRRY